MPRLVLLLAAIAWPMAARAQRPAASRPAAREPAAEPLRLDLGDGLPASRPTDPPPAWLAGDTLTGGWFGTGERLEAAGIRVGLNHYQIYQLNLRPGARYTHKHAGRYTGSYDLNLDLDLDRLARIPGAVVHAEAKGRWSDGLDGSSVFALFGVNTDAGGDVPVFLAELYYEQWFLDGRLAVRVGKLDLTDSFECRGFPAAFDGSRFANDEHTQFLNAALVNNPTIPFPDRGLGLIVYARPAEGLYVAVGAADAQGRGSQTGLDTAFHGEDLFFGIAEAGVVPRVPSPNGPLGGAYRLGVWYDPRPKDRFADAHQKRDDVGLYAGLDQRVFKECRDPDDAQGLGLFARFGVADDDVNEVRWFWSVGAQYQGLIPTRDDDVLAFGVAQGVLSPAADFTAAAETAYELYYAARLTGWLTVSPHLQYLADPGGNRRARDTLVAGIRLRVTF